MAPGRTHARRRRSRGSGSSCRRGGAGGRRPAGRGRATACCSRRVEPLEQRQRHFLRTAALDDRRQQAAGRLRLAAVEGVHAAVQQFVRLALALADRAARAVDVRLGARVPAVEEQHARPGADRPLVLAREVVIQAREQELLDAGVAVGGRQAFRLGRGVGVQAVGHIRHAACDRQPRAGVRIIPLLPRARPRARRCRARASCDRGCCARRRGRRRSARCCRSARPASSG